MVFESIVADLLNRFLGDFVDNLDASQLNIGIWGGDVKLTNLDVKETALDAFDLPVKLKFGCLDNLVLKIPWKNLYTEPVLATIEGLYLIVVPNKGVVYNEEKAKKNEKESKEKALSRLEENRRNRRKPKDPSADTFTEKLAAQVIKNLQIKIRNIHIRYEDKYTDARRPFAAGITLESLNFETTDSNWKATIHKETLNIFHKLVHLSNLAIYWNSHSSLISDKIKRAEIRAELQNTIQTQEHKSSDFHYILEPILMESRLKLNQKPEVDGSNWKIPVVDLSVDLEKLALAIGRSQYQDILLLLEAQERFDIASKFLKYRPNLNVYKGHYREWWRFAYKAILEENIRRRRRNWSWPRMKAHRQLVRDYRNAWFQKQTEKTVPATVIELIERAESELDVFNLNIARQQAEMDIDRRAITRVADQPVETWGSWAKSWWGGGAQKPKEETPKKGDKKDIMSQFEEAMTPEEKAKLFDAIDYQENTPPTDYPKTYVQNRLRAGLKSVSVTIEESLNFQLTDIAANFEQRPSARAMLLKSSVKVVSLAGCGKPMLSMLREDVDWLTFVMETNPLSGEFDHSLGLHISPVMLRYHAPAINAAIEVFKPPESVRLNQLLAAAMARYEDVKVRSMAGLQHAVEQRAKLKLDIKIEPTTVVVSEGGIFDEAKPTIITELGLLTMGTTDVINENSFKNVKSEKIRNLMIKVYDKFEVNLSNMQLLFGKNFAECMNARGKPDSPCHILRPTGLNVSINRASIDDVNIPKIRVYGALPDVVVRFSDELVVQVLKLVRSIPLPKADEPANVDLNAPPSDEPRRLRDRAKMIAIMGADELDEEAMKRAAHGEKNPVAPLPLEDTQRSEPDQDNSQMVLLDVHFDLNQIGVEMFRGDERLMIAAIHRTGFQLINNVQGMEFDIVVESMNLKMCPPAIRTLNVIAASFTDGNGAADEKSTSRPLLKEYPGYWDAKRLNTSEYWFFAEVAKEANEEFEPKLDVLPVALRTERCNFSITRFMVTVESEVIDSTKPLIQLETSLDTVAADWSGKLSLDAKMNLQMSYYNESLSVWEPVIEPIQRGIDQWEKWQLKAELRTFSEEETMLSPGGERLVSRPKTVITMMAAETLEVTLTKSFVSLLDRLKEQLDVEKEEQKAEKIRLAGEIASAANPPLLLRNLIPLDLQISQPTEMKLSQGAETSLNVPMGDCVKLTMTCNDIEYDGEIKIKKEREDLEVVTFISKNEQKKEFNVGLHWTSQAGLLECSIYVPYWMVNNTGKVLTYLDSHSMKRSKSFGCTPCSRPAHATKADSEFRHPPSSAPLLMPFAEKQIRPKKKAKLRVEGSSNSDEFPLDTAGHAGRLICKSSDGDFEVTIDVQLSNSGLTRIVTFTAFYLLQNTSKYDIEVKEFQSDEWIPVPPETCVSFWPKQKKTRKFLSVRYMGQPEESLVFPFTENFEEFVPTNSKHLGFYVTCTVAESSSVINIESFSEGMASAMFINDTELPIRYCQKGLPPEAGYELGPNQKRIFTYSDLTQQTREIEWSSGKDNGTFALTDTETHDYMPTTQRQCNYYVSFLNGRQRTVLFTSDLCVAQTAKEVFEVERMDQHVELSLRGIGISLVDNAVGHEILYASMSSSEILWEQQIVTRFKNIGRFKPFPIKVMEGIEDAYQDWFKNPTEGLTTVGSVQIDFHNMILHRKDKQPRELKIRRNFQNGFWCSYRKSAHQTQMHLKVNHLQIDNQLSACVFPCTLAMVVPPRSIAANSEPKPFAEFSFVMNQSEHSDVIQIPYLRLLVQEFDIRIDKGLLDSVVNFFSGDQVVVTPTLEIFQKDIELTKPKLSERVITTKAAKQKSFYHNLHISPLMIHLSFSQGGSSKKAGTHREVTPPRAAAAHLEFLHVLMKSFGVTVTELQNIVFKLNYFERNTTFYNRQQLQNEIISHYKIQFIKQFYVLVFGLDILGNPFGLVRDVSKGFEDVFYQPYQGLIQGPEEFAEGLALGVQSLFSHTVGGVAAAVSRFTGTVGKGIAALTLDEEYQRKRQEALNRRSTNVGEDVARSAGNVGKGIMDGVTGVVLQPIQGARQEGVGGFVKGVGKGLIGVVARPVSGVVDFASSSLNAVKTVATNAEDVRAVRHPRLISTDRIVRPYDLPEACGYKIFRDTDRGFYVDTDNFIVSAFLTEKDAFIVTDRRAMMVTRQPVVGSWGTTWQYLYTDLRPPVVTEGCVKLEFKERKKGFLGIGGSSGKGIRFSDATVARIVNEKLRIAYNNATTPK